MQQKSFFRKSLTIITLVILIVSYSCNQHDRNNTTIGAILPLSGNMAKIGLPKKNAMEIAIEDIKAIDPNSRLEIVYEDSKGTPKDGLTAYQKLLLNKAINFYYIDLTPIVYSCVPIINSNKQIVFAGSAQAEVTDQSKYLYRLFAGGEQEIEIISNYLVKSDSKRIYILHTNELYGTTARGYLERRFKSTGGEIVGSDEYSLTQKDFKDIINKVKMASFDKLVVLGYGLEFPTLLKQLIENNFEKNKLVMNLGATNAQVVALGPEYTDDITFVGPKFTYLLENNLLTPNMARFVDKYKDRYGEIPDFRAAYAYDFVMIIHQIASSDNVNDVVILGKKILGLQNYEGVSGKVAFRDNRDAITDLVLARYINGKMAIIDK